MPSSPPPAPSTTTMAPPAAPAVRERRKKRRWGDAPPSTTTIAGTSTATANGSTTTEPVSLSNSSSTTTTAIAAKAKAAALQQSIAARLAALKAKKGLSSSSSSQKQALKRPPAQIQTQQQREDEEKKRPTKKAKVYDLDLSVTTPQFKKEKKAFEKPKEKINPYLAHLKQGKTTLETKNTSSYTKSNSNMDDMDILLDSRLAGSKVSKTRIRNKELKFIEPGTFIEKAERKRTKIENAQKSGFMSGRKVGTFVKPTTMAHVHVGTDADADADKDPNVTNVIMDPHCQNSGDYYGTNENKDARTLVPRADAILTSTTDGSTKDTGGVVVIPQPLVMEWWDIPLLPFKLQKQLVQKEQDVLNSQTKKQILKLSHDKKKQTANDENKNDARTETKNNQQQQQQQQELSTFIQKCYIAASITNSKTYQLVQHPVPIQPKPTSTSTTSTKAKQPTLHLTKKEMKRQRKLRRVEKQREIQDLQAAGILPPPEPKLTLANFMKVLGQKAVLDPSQMEQKVLNQIQGRKFKHEKMNADRKLTKEQKALKLKNKLEEDTSTCLSVALFLVKDMSHRYHRTKVDLNAQQLNITGGVLECEHNPKLSLVIAEGGPKAIKKYIRLMMVRMKWKGEHFLSNEQEQDDDSQEGDDTQNQQQNDQNMDMDIDINDAHDNNGEAEVKPQPKSQRFNPDNSCELVWSGMAAKRMFTSFIFQSCPTSDHARKVLESKGAAHFWDQVIVHANGSGESFNFKLGSDDV